MALLTVKGIYKDGKVELSERPGSVVGPARVLVTFLPAEGGEGPSEDREAMRQRASARMRAGLPLGGSPYPTREELHDRHR